MLLIFFFCLIAKITLAYSDCDVGSQGVKNFDWSKVRIGVFLEQEVFKISAWFYISFAVSLTVT